MNQREWMLDTTSVAAQIIDEGFMDKVLLTLSLLNFTIPEVAMAFHSPEAQKYGIEIVSHQKKNDGSLEYKVKVDHDDKDKALKFIKKVQDEKFRKHT